jgi:phage terminase large subunit-like protein
VTPEHYPSRTVPDELSGGPHFAAFCEHYLRHTKGRWARRPLLLEPWQRAFWWEALEIDPATGLRVYQEIGLGLPRKNGKSTQASGLGLYGLCADGENEPEVYVGAGAKQQAGIVMGQSLKMARLSPKLYPSKLKVGKYTIEHLYNGGTMRALSSDGGLQHGLNPSVSLIDEVHAHKDGELFTALTTGTGAREQPLTCWITTAGVDDDNLLSDLYGQIESGPGEVEQVSPSLTIYRDRDAGVLIWWYGAPRDADIEDPRVWLECNPASWLQDGRSLERDYRKLIQKGKLLEWRIYHLNQIMGSEEGWLEGKASWGDLRVGSPNADDPWHGLDESLPVGVGIEKSPESDGGAIVVSQRVGDRVITRAKHFRAERVTGRVSTRAMRETCIELRARFPKPMVRDPKTRRPIPGPAFAYDPVAFSESAEELANDGLNMVTMGQTAATMAPASTTTFELITTGRLVHDGDPILGKHVDDSAALLTDRGMKVLKGKRRPNHSAIAMVMAVAMATHEPPRPYTRKPRTPVGF